VLAQNQQKSFGWFERYLPGTGTESNGIHGVEEIQNRSYDVDDDLTH
jgi:hypothetical protein